MVQGFVYWKTYKVAVGLENQQTKPLFQYINWVTNEIVLVQHLVKSILKSMTLNIFKFSDIVTHHVFNNFL